MSGDDVNHPAHYNQYPVEVIELTEHMPFNTGNAVKYLARAGFKGGVDDEIKDLKKAIWYAERQLTKRLAETVGMAPLPEGDTF